MDDSQAPPGTPGWERHRHACEVDQVVAWRKERGREFMVSYLELVEKHRGRKARKRLEDDVRAAWTLRISQQQLQSGNANR
jgi:hypothetical protein